MEVAVELLRDRVQGEGHPVDDVECKSRVGRSQPPDLRPLPDRGVSIRQGDEVDARVGRGDAGEPEQVTRIGDADRQLATIDGRPSERTVTADDQGQWNRPVLAEDRLLGAGAPYASRLGQELGRLGSGTWQGLFDQRPQFVLADCRG